MSKFITVYEFTWIILGTASTVKEDQGTNARDEPNNKWLRLCPIITGWDLQLSHVIAQEKFCQVPCCIENGCIWQESCPGHMMVCSTVPWGFPFHPGHSPLPHLHLGWMTCPWPNNAPLHTEWAPHEHPLEHPRNPTSCPPTMSTHKHPHLMPNEHPTSTPWSTPGTQHHACPPQAPMSTCQTSTPQVPPEVPQEPNVTPPHLRF